MGAGKCHEVFLKIRNFLLVRFLRDIALGHPLVLTIETTIYYSRLFSLFQGPKKSIQVS